MKSIPRRAPPPRPAGKEKCSPTTLSRWIEDEYRFPPYQYGPNFIITNESSWRLLNPEEKETLLGYGCGHAAACWSASQIKQQPTKYQDARLSYLGDSFSIFSFLIFAFVAAREWVPSLPYKFWAKRLGVAPGFCPHVRCLIPLTRSLQYGSATELFQNVPSQAELMNRYLLRRTNHTGSDVRVVTGFIFNNKTYPRESVQSQWWSWEPAYAKRWVFKAHINVLELQGILMGIKHQISRYHLSDMRIFQLSDSYAAISVCAKGRSSSLQLQKVLKQISAHLLAHGLQLTTAHVDSVDNPTDEASRL